MMSGFLDRILSGKYPKLESIWRTEFDRIVDQVFDKLDLSEDDIPGGLDDEFDETYVEAELNTEIKALRAELERMQCLLGEQRDRREALDRELRVVKAELAAARYQMECVEKSMDRVQKWHGEPIG